MGNAHQHGRIGLMDSYVFWKFAHVLSATILVGTGIGIAFFCWFGSRQAILRGEIGALRLVLRFTVIADAVFTAPAVIVQFVSGVVLLEQLGWSWVSPWALTVLALFLLIGACWLPVLWIQMRLSQLANAAASVRELSPAFNRLFRLWFVLGIPAFASIVMLVFMMVVKPMAVA